MDYFDNTPLIENLAESSAVQLAKIKRASRWWIAGFIIASCVAVVLYIKYDQADKKLNKR